MPSPRSWYFTLLLAIFFGWLGLDRFYIGRYKAGWLKLATLGGLGIWWILDIVLVGSEYRKDRWYRPLVHQWFPK